MLHLNPIREIESIKNYWFSLNLLWKKGVDLHCTACDQGNHPRQCDKHPNGLVKYNFLNVGYDDIYLHCKKIEEKLNKKAKKKKNEQSQDN